MGQYYKNNKIGTCENMYYMRLSEAEKLAAQGKHDDDGILFSEYLKDNTTRWRFPFPDEDVMENAGTLHAIEDHDRGFDLPAGDVEINHATICFSNQHHNGHYNMNIILPCPHSQEFKNLGIKTSNNGAGEQFLTVRYTAIRNGKEKTIFSCARCEGEQWLDNVDVEKIKSQATEYFECYNRVGKGIAYGGDQALYDYAMGIIERIK